jgi:hypothetical protein
VARVLADEYDFFVGEGVRRVAQRECRRARDAQYSECRITRATCLPERQDLQALRISYDQVVDVVTHSREVQTAHARQGDVPSTAPISG